MSLPSLAPYSLLADVFPGIEYSPSDLDKLKGHIRTIATEQHLVVDDVWFQKVLQLYQIQNIQHGLMTIGPLATGKTQAWKVLIAAHQQLKGREGVSYVIDPKAISKDSLYGTLDPITCEWNDGLFTNIVRRINITCAVKMLRGTGLFLMVMWIQNGSKI